MNRDPKNPKDKPEDLPPGVKLMEHEYDGIQEYDQRLPNWWLITLYGAILFAIGYWFIYFQAGQMRSDAERLEARLSEIEAINLEAALAMLDDENLWRMARNPQFIEAGARHYRAHCSACHGEQLEGGIGFNLADGEWVHGSKPVEIFGVVDRGIPNSGMQAWGPVLGPKRIAEVTAFVMSHHLDEAP